MAQTHLPYQKATHKPMTTAHLAQTMSLLEMNNYELLEKIHGELSNNPALELDERYCCPTCGSALISRVCPNCTSQQTINVQEPIVFVSTRREFTYDRPAYSGPDELDSFEDLSPQTEDLAVYVLEQISTELQLQERLIAAHILTSLDDDGLLPIPSIEIALYHHVPVSTVDHVLSLIQHSEPLGVGAHSAQEALIIQAEVLSDTGLIHPLAKQAITEGFAELSHQNHRALAKILNISIAEAKELTDEISENLNPFPGRAHWGSYHPNTPDLPTRYQTPDVIISSQGDAGDPQLIVEILWPLQGTLQVNPDFHQALSDAPPEKSQAWNEEYQKANLLIKCLGQRNQTMVRMMQKLAAEQRQFILKGDSYLLPLTRASLAEDLQVHESTISRAVSSKSVQLPSGRIVPISQFFDRSLHIRTVIKKIIDQEDKPLSDTKIAVMLDKKGYNVARRTVAKYRSMEGILPAHLRKKKG